MENQRKETIEDKEEDNYKKVKNFITKYFNKKIAAAVVVVGAASEYPQCFLNINRNCKLRITEI